MLKNVFSMHKKKNLDFLEKSELFMVVLTGLEKGLEI
jgi:hypothetical protein